MCMQFFTKSLNVKWKQTKDEDGVSTQTHTLRRAFQQAEVLTQVWSFCVLTSVSIRLELSQQQVKQDSSPLK